MARTDGQSPDHEHRKRSRRKHKRHRRSRSRTRSRSRSRTGTHARNPAIHVNPNFGNDANYQFLNAPPPMFPNLSIPPPLHPHQQAELFVLEQANQTMKAENVMLKQQCDFTNARLLALETELAKLMQEKNATVSTVENLEVSKKKLLTVLHGTRKKVTSLEEQVKAEDEKQKRLTIELQEKTASMEMLKMQSDNINQTCSFLTDRNGTLSKKCEELVTNQRIHLDQLAAINRESDEYHTESIMLQSDVDILKTEIEKLLEEAQVNRERESDRQLQKIELLRAIQVKEAEHQEIREKSEKQHQHDRDYIARLEAKLREENPAAQDALAMETINNMVAIMKKELTAQIVHLREELDIELRRRERMEKRMEAQKDELPSYLMAPENLIPQMTIGMNSSSSVNGENKVNIAALLRPIRSVSVDGSDIPGTWKNDETFDSALLQQSLDVAECPEELS